MDRKSLEICVATRAGKELKDGDVINLGIGLPTLVSDYLPDGITVTLQSENGIIGTGATPTPGDSQPKYVTNAGGKPASVGYGGCFIDTCTSFAFIRGGHVDCSILGALEVDQKGNLSNWIIPGKKVSGMGGAMDLVVGAKKVIVIMEHTVNNRHKILERCQLPLTGSGCVDLIITEMGVIEVMPDGLVLTEYNPEFSVEEIQNATGAKLIISDGLKSML